MEKLSTIVNDLFVAYGKKVVNVFLLIAVLDAKIYKLSLENN